MRQFFGKKSRNALATVFLISLALHVVAVLIFGTIKLVTNVMREETVFEAVPITPPPQKEPEYTVNLQQRNQSTPPPRPPAIVVNNPSELNIPALDIEVNVDSTSVYVRGGGGFGGGLAGVRQMTITADLFGMQVSATNLGVVLDVSGSAHGHLDKAISEIDKNFPDAYMIMIVGCGMSDGKGAINGGGGKVPGKPRIVAYGRRSSEDKYNGLERSAPKQLENFFRKIGEKRSKELRRYFDRRDNLYLLYGADIHGANFAFEYLLKENADTVYWFADFADSINEEIAKGITRQLKRKRAKVIAHNFMGKPVRKEAAEMAKVTGGATIEVVPGKN